MILRLGLIIAVALLVPLAPGASGATAPTPDPVTCAGYPEPRIFLENQSWWSPQLPDPARPAHPGTGITGHIHIGTCFPAYQSLAGDNLHLDVNVKLHNITGRSVNLRVYGYGDPTIQREMNGTQAFNAGKCDTADCETWMHVDLPLKDATYNGWHEFAMFLNVVNASGVVQRNWTRYYAYIDQPSKPLPPAGSTVDVTTQAVRTGVNSVTGGDTWYSDPPKRELGGSTGAYAQARIARADIPWSEATGELTPLSGVWSPEVRFEARTNFVYIDPALHAIPPNLGTVIYSATTGNTAELVKRLAIDTTSLSDGLHRLLVGTSNVATNGANTGVLVVPFLVHNTCS